MNLKTGFYIFCTTILFSVLASCLGNSEEPDYYVLKDAQLTFFGLKHDYIPELDTVKFSIDQYNGTIYNKDSMSFGTVIDSSVVVIFSTVAAGVVDVTNIDVQDTAIIKSGDSLNISKPVRLKLYAADGVTSKYYWVKLNIHQINPDSIRYWKIAENQAFLNAPETKSINLNQVFYTYSKTSAGIKLHQSTDGMNWSEKGLSGLPNDVVVKEIQSTTIGLFAYTTDGKLYKSTDAQSWRALSTVFPVKTVLGYLNASTIQQAGLALITMNGNKPVFTFTSDFQQWNYGQQDVPSTFPSTGFASLNFTSGNTERLTIIGGLSASKETQNATWSTSNGVYWAKLTDDVLGLYPLMQGANVIWYNKQLYLFNGKLATGEYNKIAYRSIDGGITWQKALSSYNLPEEYPARYEASTFADVNNCLYIVGGKQASPLTDCWKGVLNKLIFQ